MRKLESLLSWTILIVLCVGAWYMFPNEIRTVAHEVYAKVFPCAAPITYRIDTIDPKFGISKDTLTSDLKKAAELWNTAGSSDLFVYDQEHGIVGISLVYDARQEMTKRLAALGVQVSNDRASYDAIKSTYDVTLARYTSLKAVFQTHVSTFNAQKASYEKNVAYWNARGGAPRDEFQKLQSESAALTASSRQLEQEQSQLNAKAQEVNDLAATLNNLIRSLKLDVRTYNETGQSQGESFEQGVYERTAGKETITIFEYENNALLIRVLAHEMGHALGLDHVEDPDAIMYYLNKGSTIALSKADTDALALHCKKRW